MIRAHKTLALPASCWLCRSLPPPPWPEMRAWSELEYDPAQVVLIEGRTNVQATISLRRGRIDRERRDRRFRQLAGHSEQTGQSAVREAARAERRNQHDRGHRQADLPVRSGRESRFAIRSTCCASPIPTHRRSAADAQMAMRPSDAEMAAVNDPYAVTDPAQLNRAWKGNGRGQIAARAMPMTMAMRPSSPGRRDARSRPSW